MNILIMSNGIPSKRHPQAGCFAMDQAKSLANNGHKVGILCLNTLIGKQSGHLGFHTWMQNGVHCYESFGIPTAFIKVFVNRKIGMKIESLWVRSVFKKVVKLFGFPDIVHAHFLGQMVLGAEIKKKYNICLVGTEHWSKLATDELKSYIKLYGDYAYPHVDKLISVSENLKNCILHHFGKDSVVIHNLIDISGLKTALNGITNAKYTIVGVGSLIPRKGFDLLISAIANSSLPKDKILVKIFGGGECYDELTKLIQDKNLTNTIRLCGTKTKPEIYEELHNADLFVLSSHLENFSVAMIEATANGLPAVATLCGGIEEYPVCNVTKIPVNDIEAMSTAIENAYENRNSINRLEIQQQTLRYFSPSAITKQIEQVYNEVLVNKH